MKQLVKFILLDILKNKIVISYTILLALFSWSVFSLEDTSSKGILTMLNIILLTVPLVSILFSTIYIYNCTEFVELLLSQPIQRKKIWISLFTGLLISFIVAFILGAGIPILLFVPIELAFMMISIGIIISSVFVSLAFFSSIVTRDKARGIGISVLLWLYFALLFDGIVLFLLFQFAEYPIEKLMVGLTASSPIDLARILILLQLDISAMMGYTGAIFKDIFGTTKGLFCSFSLLVIWILIPFLFSLRIFKHRDL
jgi:Cu-processing system permease protein